MIYAERSEVGCASRLCASLRQDLRARISNYEAVYETVEDDEQLSYIKLINLQSKVICNRIYGKVAQKIVGFLMAIHTGTRLVLSLSVCVCVSLIAMSRRSTHLVDTLGPLRRGGGPGPAAGWKRGDRRSWE
jgi:hypothetical protein